MLKKILLSFLFLLLINTPILANELDQAIERGDNVFLYLYSPKCKYCVMFNPIYQKMYNKYNKDFYYIKKDTTTQEGRYLLNVVRGRYVPFVVLLNKNKEQGVQISPSCLLEEVCVERTIKDFIK